MLRRRLLTTLFVCILLPVLVILFRSTAVIISQKETTMDSSGKYVGNLANYAADMWNESAPDRIDAFLSLVADHGYDMLVSIEGARDRQKLSETKQSGMRGKFVPGLVAYVSLDGRLVLHSQNAAILLNIFDKALKESPGNFAETGEHITGNLRTGDKDVAYVASISPTSDPRIYAVAAVTMMSWMGTNDIDMIQLSSAGILGMLICLVGLFLLHRSVIRPLQALSSEVGTLRWGEQMPEAGAPRLSGEMQIEEITSLKSAIKDLARRMIEKDELEKRYVHDIIKAQEAERDLIAQDIHDGPIQVLSALVQRVQIAGMSKENLPADVEKQLGIVEEIAQDLVEDLRDICDSLVPPWVSLGLASCMEESASRFERQYEIDIRLQIENEIPSSQEVTLALFRIFQEAVSNAVRHGHATEIELGISRGECGELSFRICDNGEGFVFSEDMLGSLLREGKRGLTGMKQRVALLGGDFELRSEPQHGTAIIIKLHTG